MKNALSYLLLQSQIFTITLDYKAYEIWGCISIRNEALINFASYFCLTQTIYLSVLTTLVFSCTCMHTALPESAGTPALHAHCPPGFCSTCTHIPAAPLSTLQAPPHTCKLLPRYLQLNAVTCSRSYVCLWRQLYIHTQYTPLLSACICTHIPTVSLSTAGTCSLKLTATLWHLGASALVCRQLYLRA